MDYLLDYWIRRRLHQQQGPLRMADLAQELRVTDTELIDALRRLVQAGHIEKRGRTMPQSSALELPSS
jgi:predicted transcriptional regulator